jgi:membrane-bound lytic murein transglycosylase B
LLQINASATTFESWLRDFKKEALTKGISSLTLKNAFKNVKPIPRVVELDRKQPEFTLTFKQYLNRVVSKRRTKIGKSKLIKHKELLLNVSRKFNVQPRFIIALWGIETDFGRITGGFPVIASLATLAFDGRRSSFFRKELFLALKIIEDGHITAENMKGSWAGAMGQNQFMPSSFHSFAIDYDGDGSADIWNSLPDIFASIANYLSRSGWKSDQNWGRPVLIPATLPKNFLGKNVKKEIQRWSELGVKRANGKELPIANMTASIIRPEKGGIGPAYIVYNNYRVILKWNRSDYFATAVGTLADSLR